MLIQENTLKSLMEKYWSNSVTEKEKYHTPEGLFSKSGDTIAKTLLQGANGDKGKAIKRLMFYMNRAGEKLENKSELDKAKGILEKKEEKK